MTKHEKQRLNAAIERQYQSERKKQGCLQALLGVILWIGIFCFIYYSVKTL